MKLIPLIVLGVGALALGGCSATLSQSELIGGGAGCATGALVGATFGGPIAAAGGAVIGCVAGAKAGEIYDDYRDQPQAK